METINGFLSLKKAPLKQWQDIEQVKTTSYLNLLLEPTTVMVNVVAFDHLSFNWATQGHPDLPGWFFPEFLPRHIFKRKKEGHAISLIINRTLFKLILTQNCYFKFHKDMYKDNLYNFETVLAKIHDDR